MNRKTKYRKVTAVGLGHLQSWNQGIMEHEKDLIEDFGETDVSFLMKAIELNSQILIDGSLNTHKDRPLTNRYTVREQVVEDLISLHKERLKGVPDHFYFWLDRETISFFEV